jgi:CO/xanthine dehydrogenase FAD-binding subunit
MIQFEYFRPKSLEEALSLSARFGEKGRFMAGGTEVINELRMGKSWQASPGKLFM